MRTMAQRRKSAFRVRFGEKIDERESAMGRSVFAFGGRNFFRQSNESQFAEGPKKRRKFGFVRLKRNISDENFRPRLFRFFLNFSAPRVTVEIET